MTIFVNYAFLLPFRWFRKLFWIPIMFCFGKWSNLRMQFQEKWVGSRQRNREISWKNQICHESIEAETWNAWMKIHENSETIYLKSWFASMYWMDGSRLHVLAIKMSAWLDSFWLFIPKQEDRSVFRLMFLYVLCFYIHMAPNFNHWMWMESTRILHWNQRGNWQRKISSSNWNCPGPPGWWNLMDRFGFEPLSSDMFNI